MSDVVELIIKLTNDKNALKTLGDLLRTKETLNKGEINLRARVDDIRRAQGEVDRLVHSLRGLRDSANFRADGVADLTERIQYAQREARQLALDIRTAMQAGDKERARDLGTSLRVQQQEILNLDRMRKAIRDGEIRNYNELLSAAQRRKESLADELRVERDRLQTQKDVVRYVEEEIRQRERAKQTTDLLNRERQKEYDAAVAQSKRAADARSKTQRAMYASAQEFKELRAEALRNDLEAVLQILQDSETAVESLKQSLTETGSAPGRLVQSVGKGISAVGSTIESFGGIFTKNNVVDTLERYATIMGSRLFTQNWGKAFERYDILSTYSKYLDMIGVSAAKANASLTKLNAGIQGIPVGLSDVAYQTRMYQMYLDDLERATNLAVGLERALVAGGANEQMRNTARYEIDRLLSAGELSTTRQYRALLQGLGVSSRYLREEMGFGALSNADFVNQLMSKQISGDDLIRGLESLASSDKLNNAIEVYRTTIESGLSNIQFALTRGKANILSTFNETLEASTGKGISGWLYQIRDGINAVYISMQRWIKSNPEQIKGFVDTLVRMFNRLREVDWGKIVGGVVGGFEKLLNIMIDLSEKIPEGWFESFVVFSTVWATPVGKSIRLFGDGLQSLGAQMAKFGAAALLAKAGFSNLEQLKVIAPQAAAALAAAGKSALVGAGWFSAAAAALAGGIGLAIYDAKKAAESAEKFAAEKGLTDIDSELEQRKMTYGAYELISTNLDESGRNEAIANIRAVKDELLSLDRELKQNRTLLIERNADAVSRDDLDFTSVDREKLATLKRDIEDAYSISLRIDPETGSLDAHSQKLAEAAVAYDEYSAAVEQSALAEERIEEARKARNEKLDERTWTLQEIARLEEEIANYPVEKGPEGEDLITIKDGEKIAALRSRLQALKTDLAENHEEVVGYGNKIANLYSQLGALRNTISSIRMDSIFGSQEWNELSEPREAVAGLISAYRDLAVEAQKSIDSQLKGFEKFKKTDDMGLGTLKENLQSQIDALDKFNVNIGTIEQYALRTGNETLQALTADLANQGVADGAAYAQGVVDEINRVIAQGEGADTTKLESLISLYDEKRDKEKLAAEATQFANAATSAFNEAISEIQPDDLDQMGLFAKMLYGSTDPKELAEALKEFVTGDTSLSNWFTTARESAETEAPQVQQHIEDTSEKIQAFTSNGIVPLKEAEDDAKTATEELTDAAVKLAQTLSQKLTTVMAFKAGIELMEASVRAAKSAVDALREAIASLEDKTVTVTYREVREGGSAGGNDAGQSGNGATGGLITGPGPAKYFSKGGWVFMKPKGTDTVPAMLTPGEYVMRKKAVDRLGVPFLQRLNRLDIGGAFDAVMSRVYKPSFSELRSYNTYNNTSNDNRKYSNTQYITTNNPDYSVRVANRFAHAL